MRKNAPRLIGYALFWVSSVLMLSASSCIVQEPQRIPGQQLTWQEEHALKMKEYQTLGDNRRDRPCPPSSCK